MKNIYILICLISLSFTGLINSQNLTQATLLKTGPLQITVYARPTATVNAATNISVLFALSLPADGPGTLNGVSHIGGTLTGATPELINGRMCYPFNIDASSSANALIAGVDNQIATITFPTSEIGDLVQMNDFTGSGTTNVYWYISYFGDDGTNYDEKFYGINANNGPDSWVTANAPLPVTLASFDAEKHQTRSSLLSWSTASEINSSHFLVQRSSDKKEWKTVGKVNAAGESQIIRNYNFVDENVYNGFDASLIVYYRLMSIDLDGQTKGSPIESVVFGNSDIAKSRNFIAYPNPASDGIHVAWNGDIADQPTDIEFYDTNGKQVFTHKVGEKSHEEYVDFTRSNLQAGLYLMRVMSGDEPVEFKQIVIGQN